MQLHWHCCHAVSALIPETNATINFNLPYSHHYENSRACLNYQLLRHMPRISFLRLSSEVRANLNYKLPRIISILVLFFDPNACRTRPRYYQLSPHYAHAMVWIISALYSIPMILDVGLGSCRSWHAFFTPPVATISLRAMLAAGWRISA